MGQVEILHAFVRGGVTKSIVPVVSGPMSVLTPDLYLLSWARTVPCLVLVIFQCRCP